MTSEGAPAVERVRQSLSALRALLLAGSVEREEGFEQASLAVEALEGGFAELKADAVYAYQRLTEISAMLTALAGFDYSKRATSREGNDAYDGLSVFLNMLAEELSASTVSKEYLHNIVDSMTEMLLVFDKRGQLKMANKATVKCCGYTQDELINQPISMLLSEVDMAKILGNKAVRIEETTCRTKAGGTLTVSFSTSIMRDRKGDIDDIVGLARDLTEVKQVQEERLKMEKVIQRQRIVLEELSTPLIPVTNEMMIMPLVGSLDRDRIKPMCETLLAGIIERRARVVIIDITGLRTVDGAVIQAIMSAAQGAKLLGAEVVLTGVQAGIAAALVSLNAELYGIEIKRSLKSAIAQALRAS